MKAVGIAFSAREKGSCASCLQYCLDAMAARGLETVLVNCYDLDIRPCHRCRYQCMVRRGGRTAEPCPVDDDVRRVYEMAMEADILLLAVPTYGGEPAALYRAWAERAQMLPDDDLERLDGTLRGLIVIGNASAGGGRALHAVTSFGGSVHPEAVLLSATDYAQRSVAGRLAEDDGVRRRLDAMVDRLAGRLGERRGSGDSP